MDCESKNWIKLKTLDFNPKYWILGWNSDWNSKFSAKIQILAPQFLKPHRNCYLCVSVSSQLYLSQTSFFPVKRRSNNGDFLTVSACCWGFLIVNLFLLGYLPASEKLKAMTFLPLKQLHLWGKNLCPLLWLSYWKKDNAIK